MEQMVLGVSRQLGTCEGKLVEGYCDLGELYLKQAKRMQKLALGLNEELNCKRSMIENCDSLGEIYRMSGDLEKAEKIYRKWLSLAKDLGNKVSIAAGYTNLGNLAGEQERLTDACKYWQQAKDLFHDLKMEPQIKLLEDALRSAGCLSEDLPSENL